MDNNILILTGSIITSVLVLAGVIWQTRARPEPLSQVVKTQQEEINRLSKRITEQQTQIDELNSRLGTVTKLERDKSRILAGVFLLTNQLRAAGLAPVWELPEDVVQRGDDTRPPRHS